ncbi:MAG: hypothetical protein RLZZ387_449 [Chloroflexota bacterium]|jgi:hypothetical protein
MAQKNGITPNDPIGSLRSLRDATLDAWAKTMVEAVNTETFARGLGAYLDTYLAASAPLQRAVDQYMKTALARLSLPSRDEVVTLAKRMTSVEMRLDDIEVKIDQIAVAIRAQAPVIVEMLEEELAQSARQEGEQVELDGLEDRLKTLDDKTDRLLHLLERLQAPPPPPAAPRAQRGRKVKEPEEPPTAEDIKEDRAIEGF